MTSSDENTTESTEDKCEDLAAPNESGCMEYQPGAYLADGAKILAYAKCDLGEEKTVYSPQQAKIREVSLLYPSSGEDGPVATSKIPIGGLVLQPTLVDGVSSRLHVGVPLSVYQVLRKIIPKAVYHYWTWCPTMRPQDGHHWLYAQADKNLVASVYVQGKRKEVEMSDLFEQVNRNLECDAFVAVRASLPSGSSSWSLEMTVEEVLIIGTTDAQSHSFRGSQLLGRQKWSSPEIVSAFEKLQVAAEEAKATTSA